MGQSAVLCRSTRPHTFSCLNLYNDHHFSLRSSSAWAKKAEAVFNISLARRNVLFSFSSALMRSRSSAVVPGISPASICDRCSHAFRLSGEQPILPAIEQIACQREGYSLSCSNTMRTARSLTSGEYRFDLFITPIL